LPAYTGLHFELVGCERDKSDAARFGATRYIRKPSNLDDFLSLGAIFKAALSKPEP
jgi:hypothetical protein